MPRLQIRPRSANRDAPAELLPLDQVTAVSNMVPRDQVLAQASGYATRGPDPLQFQPRYLLSTQTAAQAYWIHAGDTGVGVTDLDTLDADITPPGFASVASLTQPYTGGIIEQNPVLNIRNVGPFWWDRNPANPMAALPDWTAGDLAESVRPFREFLVAMNIQASGQRIADLVRVSDAASPGEVPQSWTPGVGSEAVERSVAFNPGGLVDGLQLVDRFYMYKTSSVYLLQYIAGAFVFSTRPVFSTFGALSRNCIVEWRGQHIVLTDGDLIIHDGLNARSMIEERIRREIFDQLGGNEENSFLYLDAAQELVAVCRPRGSEVYPSEAWIVSLSSRGGEPAIGQVELPPATPHVGYGIVAEDSGDLELTWAEKTTTWATDPTRWSESAFLRTADQALVADHRNSELLALVPSTEQGATILQAVVERDAISLDAPDFRKYVRRVWPGIEAAGGAQFLVEVGAHDHPDDPVTWGTPQPFTVGEDRFVNVDVQGYYLAYRITSTGQLPWRLAQLQLELEQMGRF